LKDELTIYILVLKKSKIAFRDRSSAKINWCVQIPS
jgi:hypothetical protein